MTETPLTWSQVSEAFMLEKLHNVALQGSLRVREECHSTWILGFHMLTQPLAHLTLYWNPETHKIDKISRSSRRKIDLYLLKLLAYKIYCTITRHVNPNILNASSMYKRKQKMPKSAHKVYSFFDYPGLSIYRFSSLSGTLQPHSRV